MAARIGDQNIQPAKPRDNGGNGGFHIGGAGSIPRNDHTAERGGDRLQGCGSAPHQDDIRPLTRHAAGNLGTDPRAAPGDQDGLAVKTRVSAHRQNTPEIILNPPDQTAPGLSCP